MTICQASGLSAHGLVRDYERLPENHEGMIYIAMDWANVRRLGNIAIVIQVSCFQTLKRPNDRDYRYRFKRDNNSAG
jgi:hypothetical protein